MEQVSSLPLQQLFPNLKPILSNPAPFKQDWNEGSSYYEAISDLPILVVGAGGLGCEIVKNLALSGVREIHLVDMDTIDFTNLNRQFMFRQKDIGKYKADVVAEFVKTRCPGVKIVTYKKRVQEIPFNQYRQFPIIVGGLDNVEARKYLNKIAFLINQEEEDTQCYYIDGATEGFEGQCLVVDPYKSSCYECSILDGVGAQIKANYCTIANKPRTPQHCVQYVLEKQWEQERSGEVRDNDNLEHLEWIYQKSLARAKQFKIEGVTPMLALGVTKNVIPAIASTNALIAAATTNEVFKILTGCNPSLNNYMLYKGGTFIGCQVDKLVKKPTCQACKTRENRLDKLVLKLSGSDTFEKVLEEVKGKFQYLGQPFVNHNGKIVLNPGDVERYQARKKTSITDLISEGKLTLQGSVITVEITDKCLKSELEVQIFLN